MRLLREMYLATLSRHLNDVSDESENPDSHTDNLFLGICFEACKLNQVWNDLLKDNYILWDANNESWNINHCSINKQMFVCEFSRATRNCSSECAVLQQFIRINYATLTDLSCCTHESCPLQ